MFLGAELCGIPASFENIQEPSSKINNISLSNMYLDELYGTTHLPDDFNIRNIEKWSYGTFLHATYEDGLSAGNITYSADVISATKIKKRIQGEQTWKTIYVQKGTGAEKNGVPSFTVDDFAINFIDYLEPSNRVIEYQYVPVFNVGGEEQDMDSEGTEVLSKFDSWFLVGQYEDDGNNNFIYDIHPMVADTTVTKQLNKQFNTVQTLYGKYPFVVNNGNNLYYSGSATATFFELCSNDGMVDAENGWKYRNTIDQFLSNGMAKIMKSFEGDIYLITVNDNISHSQNGHYQNVNTSFNWVEIGDPFSVGDLYDNGFINTEIDRGLD